MSSPGADSRTVAPADRRRLLAALAGAVGSPLLAAPWVALARVPEPADIPTDPSDPAGPGWPSATAVPRGPAGDQPPPPPYDFPRRPPRRIRVDIAAATAEAREFDGREAIRSRAIVGAPRTPTPRLTRVVPSVRVNPPWYVPASIEPEIERPEANGYRRINGRLVLPPGPNNPLGVVRIGLADSDGIFLHATNAPGLFARDRRALSHGCVRLERAVEIAAWVVGVTPEAMRAAIATRRTFEIAPPDEVVVTLA